MKKIALLLALLLFACGCTKRNEETPPPPPAVSSAETPAPTPAAEKETAPLPPAPEAVEPPEPTETEKPSPTPAPPVEAGVYLFESEEFGAWRLHVKENGTFSLIGGEEIFNGEGWADTGRGTVITGPTEAAGKAPFFDEFGSSEWRIEGERCTPVY